MGIPSITIACCLFLQALSRCEASEGSPSPIADDIVREAKSHIGDPKWSRASNYSSGPNTDKYHIFVADVMKEAGGSVPSWYFYGGPIGAGEWGSRWSFYLMFSPSWITVNSPLIGDVIGDGQIVGIMTGPNKTTHAGRRRVVENDWGFRPNQSLAYWRYFPYW
ncbi:hypothetical protein SNE40_017075 [Patella caerulea]|uniref:Uncharacterized protein n=1 Tax=Patella caerulea TaxID=87958 RepID=A0AAN8JD61_PATCE